MKIFTFAYDKFTTMTTGNILRNAGVEFNALCYTKEQYEKFINAGTLLPSEVIITNGTNGLANQRNFVLEHCMNMNEWCLMLVDDMEEVTTLSAEDLLKYDKTIPVDIDNSTEWSHRFKNVMPTIDFIKHCEYLTWLADKQNIYMVGFTDIKNPLFRRAHWNYNRLVPGRCVLLKKTNLRYHPNIHCLESFYMTAMNLQSFGKVLIDQWTYFKAQLARKGQGYGSLKEREPQMRVEMSYLLETYPQFFETTADKDYGTYIKMRRGWAKYLSNKSSLYDNLF